MVNLTKVMEKVKSKKYRFRIPIYGYCVDITVSEDIMQAIKDANIDYNEKGVLAVHFPVVGEPLSLLFLPLDADVNTIVHESTHVAQTIVDWIGAGYKDMEFIAYLFAHVAQGVYEYHQKAKKVLESVDK